MVTKDCEDIKDNSTNNDEFIVGDSKEVFRCNVFKVIQKDIKTRDGQHGLRAHTLTSADWVNVVPVTASGKIVVIEQFRFGPETNIFEVPGGSVDFGEKDATMSALRELEEETKLTSQRIISLPSFYPNPPLQQNKIHYFIAFDVQPLEQSLAVHHDPFEKIKLHFYDIKDAMHLVRIGRISHSLSALALLLAEPYLVAKFK